MGFFKDVKNTVANTVDAAKNTPAAKQAAEVRATEAQAGLVDGTQDRNDPGFEPVEASRSSSTPSCARRWPGPA